MRVNTFSFLKKSFRLLQFSFFTAQRLQRSDDVCKEGKMQTSNAEDVFKALDEIEFPELVEPLRTALDEAKRQPGAKQRKLDKEPMLQSEMIEQTKPTRTTINCSNLVVQENLEAFEQLEAARADEEYMVDLRRIHPKLVAEERQRLELYQKVLDDAKEVLKF
ncbi:DNA polymerase epsilon subunit 3-like [Triticum aestivum]|uniref:DNA polymerase epsilon subunit 3-like n=1 Tax=Triticum aestivum TaxID=4565 RepID=UPI001D00EC71|nr:DNA polymerase epsilon subunit 3-like [Triticum aestivum]